MNTTLSRIGSRASREDALTLVEVTLASAIVGLALVVVIGLLPVGIDSSRQIADETIVANLASDMLHWRRVTPYDKSPYLPLGATNLTVHAPTAGAIVTNYYDASGNTTNNVDNTPNLYYTGPRYQVVYTITNHPQFATSPDIARVIVEIKWPVTNAINLGVAANAQRRVYIGQFARTE